MPNARIGETVEIYDGLDSTNPDAALSANMGSVLNGKITALSTRVTALESSSGSGSDTTITLATASDVVALFN